MTQMTQISELVDGIFRGNVSENAGKTSTHQSWLANSISRSVSSGKSVSRAHTSADRPTTCDLESIRED